MTNKLLKETIRIFSAERIAFILVAIGKDAMVTAIFALPLTSTFMNLLIGILQKSGKFLGVI